MKRPLYLVAIAWILGELLAINMKYLFLSVPVLLLFLWKEKKRGICLLLFLFSFYAGYWRYEEEEDVLKVYDAMEEGEAVRFYGRVESCKETEYAMTLVVLAKKISGEAGGLPSGIRMTVQFEEDPEVIPGQYILASGSKKAFQIARNPGNFDEKSYQNSLGVVIKLTDAEILEVRTKKNSFRASLEMLKKELCHHIDLSCDETEAGIIKAIVYGEKETLGDEEKQLFQKSGIAHILAISGLHMSALGLGIYRLCRRKLSFLSAGVCSISCLFAFGIMTGFGISVQRAVIMMFLRILGDVKGRSYDVSVSTSVSALFVLYRNPYALLGGSFILSFGTIYLIAIIYPQVVKRLLWNCSKKEKKKYKKRLGNFAGIFTGICQMPVLALLFNEFSPYGILLNLVVIPLLSVLFFGGLFASFLYWFHPVAGKLVIYVAVLVVRIYIRLCEGAQTLPFGRGIYGFPSIWKISLFLLLCLLIWILISGQKDLKKRLTTFFVGMLLLFLLACKRELPHSCVISVLDVGQGDATLIQTEQGKNYLIDGGSTSKQQVGAYQILPYLKYQGVSSLDAIFISHGDEDHMNGILELMKGRQVEIKMIFLGVTQPYEDVYAELVQLAGEMEIAVCEIYRGDCLKLDELVLTVYHPEKKEYADINDASLVFQVEYGAFRMLFTGDISETTEEELLELLEPADVLKTAHHGSKTASSGEFLNRLKVRFATISCGVENRYGHPHKEVLERMEEAGICYAITAQQGCIHIYAEKTGKYRVTYFLKDAG